jgi:putative CocE/NonD family hydrolase
VRREDHWITLSDGVRLAATLYLPDRGRGPWPAILEYLPYRKDDWTLPRDLELYPFVVDRGYVGARVDIRGTGRSEGRLPPGEYSEQEQADGLEVIAWLAGRPWSTGTVGMWGISWGGFNAIQLAVREPPALKAIVAVDASDDLFHDDIHYIDGIWHLDEYEVGIDLWNAMTPAPEFPVDEEALADRFDTEPWLLSWLRHQRDGPFWRRGSLAPEYERLRVPALLVGGLLDGYRDSVARMLSRVPAPARAIVGPWNHTWPHDATPGPEIEWRREAVRWWDQWLKGRDAGVLSEPRLTAFQRHWHPPDLTLETVPGTWRAEEWPVEGAEDRVLHPTPDGGLEARPARRQAVHRVPYRPSAGAEAGSWWGELTPDQTPLDASCLVYQTAPLRQDLAILGIPVCVLAAAVDAPVAHFFVRLSDVAPGGSVTLVTGGGLNGAHRRSAFLPEPLEPGVAEQLEVPLRFTSWVFPAGHRIRLAVSNHLWPMMWPTPHRMTLSLHMGGPRGTHLVLPVVPTEGRPAPGFELPARDPPPEVGSRNIIQAGAWRVDRFDGSALASWRNEEDVRFPGGSMRPIVYLRCKVSDDRPDLAAALGEGDIFVTVPGRTITWRTRVSLRSDGERFHCRFRRILGENGRQIRERSWEESIPREFQ